MNLSPVLAWHRTHFPIMTAQDIVKLVFQAYCGCGHLLDNEDAVLRRIEAESSQLLPDATEPLLQPLGQYIRLNLRRAMAASIAPRWIARMMRLSAMDFDGQAARAFAAEALLSMNVEATDEATLSQQELHTAARRLLEEPQWLPGHSEAYHRAYQPAYRVISRQFAWLLDALSTIGQRTSNQRLLVCVDGPCASGKSTMAEQLAAITDAAIIHMDDFYTPHAQKTPERLAQPAGNADIKRFLNECLYPWLQHGVACFRPYLCHADVLGDVIHIPQRPITIIEGSYSLHPDIAAHADIKLWISAPTEVRHERILRRNGEAMLQRFIQQWIPLEEAYASAFSLPDEGCICLSGEDVQDV